NKKQDDEALVNKMKEIVPEFISKNSHFEYLDTCGGNDEEYAEILLS
ncbi:MAG: polysaccharide biosynthesis protein, partial [Mucilaginibacter sp.]|nr:polysaccharide biosynthesis protein [Mucilaginibacter sp.]